MSAIAKVLKSYGTDGTVLVSFRDGIPEDFSTERPVFLLFEGLPVPFFITSFHRKGNVRAEIRFEDIDCLKDAEELVGKEVFPDESERGSEENDDGKLCVEDLEGFTVLSEDGAVQGTISSVDDYSGNVVFTLSNGRIIPYHDDLLRGIDEESSIITLIIPEGL